MSIRNTAQWFAADIPGTLPALDVIVMLRDREGQEYQGALLDAFYDDTKLFWAEWDGGGYTEKLGEAAPIAWRNLFESEAVHEK